MTDDINIIGIKIENNIVYTEHKEEPGVFNKTVVSEIKQIENILTSLSKCTWPNKSKKENVIFETEKDIGVGMFKDYVDKDGDKTFQFATVPKEEVELNEDVNFDIKDVKRKEEIEINENPWGAAMPFQETVKMKEVNYNPKYKFIKRDIKNRSDEITKLRDKLMRLFITNLKLTKIDFKLKPNLDYKCRKGICFLGLKPSAKQRGIDGELCLSTFKYSAKKKIENVFEKNFYLRSDK